jgi:hypothetical protein
MPRKQKYKLQQVMSGAQLVTALYDNLIPANVHLVKRIGKHEHPTVIQLSFLDDPIRDIQETSEPTDRFEIWIPYWEE